MQVRARTVHLIDVPVIRFLLHLMFPGMAAVMQNLQFFQRLLQFLQRLLQLFQRLLQVHMLSFECGT